MTEHTREYQKNYFRSWFRTYRGLRKERVRETQKQSRKRLAKRNFATQSWMADRRRELGYTQAELAKLCGTTQATISLLESGQRTLATFCRREKVYEVLGVET